MSGKANNNRYKKINVQERKKKNIINSKFFSCLIIGIFILIVMICLNVEADTLEVDDSGSKEYTKIQDAIDDAIDGDTILVYEGNYSGNIEVYKSVIIEKDDTEPLIDAMGGNGMNVTADNVTINGLNITNSNIAIYCNASGFNFRNNIFVDILDGIYWEIDEREMNKDMNIFDILIDNNVFYMADSEEHAVIIDIFLDYNDNISDINIGDITLVNNLIYMDKDSSGVGIFMNGEDGGIRIYELGGGSIFIGNMDISDNKIFGGMYGIKFYGDLYDFTNVEISIGDYIIESNTLSNQSATSISINYYDATLFQGNSLCFFGDLSINENNIISDYETNAILVENYTYLEHFYGTTTLNIGDLNIERNFIDVEGYGIKSINYKLANEFHDMSGANLGKTNIRYNQILNSSFGIDFRLNKIENMSNISYFSMDSMNISDNNIHASSDGICFITSDLGIEIYDDATVYIDDFVIYNNIIKAEMYGIYEAHENWAYNIYDNSIFDFGDITINENQIECKYGIFFEYFNEIGYKMYNESNFIMGNIQINNNEINSSDDGIYIYEFNEIGSNLFDFSSCTFGNIEICQNLINSTSNGIYIYYIQYFGYHLYNQSGFIMGNILVNNNRIYSEDYGIGLNEMNSIGFYLYDDASYFMENIEFCYNYIESKSYGLYIDYFQYFGQNLYDNATYEFGNILINYNEINNSVDDGIYIYEFYDFAYDMYNDSSFKMGDIEINYNHIESEEEGLYVEYFENFGYNLYGNAVINLGNISLNNNFIKSTDYGLHIDYIENFGYNMKNNAKFKIMNITVNNNDIYSETDGIYIQDIYKFGFNMYNETSFIMESIEINNNKITSLRYGISFDNLYEFGYQTSEKSKFLMEDIKINNNNILCFNNSGVNINNIRNFGNKIIGDSNFNMNNFEICDNIIKTYNGDGVKILEINNFGYIIEGNSTFEMGNFKICNNSINSTNDGITISFKNFGNSIKENSTFMMGAIEFNENHIECYEYGINIYFNEFGYEMYGYTTFTMSNIEFNKNEIYSNNTGIKADISYFGEDMYEYSTFLMSNIETNENYIISQGYGLYVYLDGFGVEMYDNSNFIVNNFELNRNEVYSNATGIYAEIEYMGDDLYNNCTFSLGDIEFLDNYLDCEEIGLKLHEIYSFAEGIEDDSSYNMKNILVKNNIIYSDSDGIYINKIDDIGYSMKDNSHFKMENIEFINNTIFSNTSGINFNKIRDIGYDMEDNSSMIMGNFHVDKNRIECDTTAIYFDSISIGTKMNQYSNFIMENFTINSNYIDSKGNGTYINEIMGIGHNMYDNSTMIMGNLEINNNIINSSYDGIFLNFEGFGYYRYDDSEFIIGDISILENIITNCKGEPSGIHVEFLNDSIISLNSIQNCSYGIYLWNSTNNLIFHNIFINNDQNSFDNSENFWDDGIDGNYWDDYIGLDDNNDGIGDTPYDIFGGDLKDNKPLMKPYIEGPIIAVAGIDQIVTQGTEVIFDGSGSTDNIAVLNWTWKFNYNSSSQALYTETVKFVFWTVGDYKMTLTVFDNRDNSDSDLFWVNVTDITPPKADAGHDLNDIQDKVFTLNGSDSTDNVAIVNWTWTFNYDGIDYILYDEISNFKFQKAGNYDITLTVRDAVGLTDSDIMIVNVIDITPPVANAGDDRFAVYGLVATLDGSNSFDNLEIVNWTWTFRYNDTQYKLYGEKPKFTFWILDEFEITLSVKDAIGFSVEDVTIISVISDDIEPPNADAGGNLGAKVGGKVIFDGSGSKDNVEIVNWTWEFKYNLTDIKLYGEIAEFTFWTVDEYQVRLTVTDIAKQTDIDTISLIIFEDDTEKPKAETGIDQTVAQGKKVIFDGSGSSDNLGIVNWTWAFNDNGLKKLYGEKPYYYFANIGKFDITLTVTDVAGLTDTDIMLVNVTEKIGTGTFNGIIKDKDGTPIKGAMIKIIENGFIIGTDENGEFIITDIPKGSYTIKIEKEGYEVITNQITIKEGESTTLNLSLSKILKTGIIKGVVKDRNGVPIHYAVIEIFGTNFTTKTDDKGAYIFENVPVGSYTIKVSKDGKSIMKPVSVVEGKTTNKDIELEIEGKEKTDNDSNMGIIILIIIFIIIILLTFLFAMKKKQEEEITDEKSGERNSEDQGSDSGDTITKEDEESEKNGTIEDEGEETETDNSNTELDE